MATLMALVLQKEYPKRITLYTYGSPRVGNAHFVRHLLEHDVVHYRYVDFGDVVPSIPRVAQGSISAQLRAALAQGILPEQSYNSLCSLFPILYLHHGTLCHIINYHGHMWVLARLGQGELQGKVGRLALTDMPTTSGYTDDPFDSHSIQMYLDNMKSALANQHAISGIETEEALREAARLTAPRGIQQIF